MEKAFALIKTLVDDFKAKESAFLSPPYQEMQVREDYLNKFFSALGWDVAHNIQKDPYQQEVHIENKVLMAGSPRRADYAFCLAPNFRDPKFFVEAKKPSRNLANPDDYYQTIRYGWNANTPIAILTDFEELHILDCRFKPSIKDVLIHKIEFFHYSDYANEEKFARLYWLFSREAVANGSLEKRAAELPQLKGKAVKGGYQPVDEAFLEELDTYREVLAKAFKKSNPDLQSEELTEAIQRTIDRLVFIRFLEDKQIEEPAIIHLPSKKSTWKGFLDLCKQMDPKYNGLVFKPHKLLDGKEFAPPDDEEFGTICRQLSDPHSPYNFDQIPISILGSIYERFLGKVVHATDKRVKVEEKPEVRKAGGVYYTPQYIVRYIVDETVGKLIEGKSPMEIAPMSFADIACGSGSFLIEVYSKLLDYHIRWYTHHPEEHSADNVYDRDGKLHLTLKKKKEILTNNVYGVDIDFQATEVTQLSLYLKLLEDVTMHDAHQYGMFKETILPDMRGNIVCGNSLIGRDIAEGELFSDVDENKLKPMDFEDAFPAVMKRGGFDAVVGNPPYIRLQSIGQSGQIDYLSRAYKATGKGNYDIYVVFVERGLQLMSPEGKLGFILPHKFFNAKYGEPLRGHISSGSHLDKIVHFGDKQIFKGATTYTCLLFLAKSKREFFEIAWVDDPMIWQLSFSHSMNRLPASSAGTSEWNFVVGRDAQVRSKLEKNNTRLPDIADIFVGLQTSADTVFLFKDVSPSKGKCTKVFSKELGKEYDIETKLLRPVVRSGEIGRFWASPTASVLFPYQFVNGKITLFTESEMEEVFPRAWKYLLENKKLLSSRENGKFRTSGWYQLYPKNLALWEEPKLLVPYMVTQLSSYWDCEALYFVNVTTGGFGIRFRSHDGHPYYYNAILNSSTLDWYFKKISSQFHGGYYAANKQFLAKLPIRMINFSDPSDKARHDHVVSLVEKMLDAKGKLQSAKTDGETSRLELLCESLDRQIDAAVYELYGLTKEEIGIVEGNPH